MHPAAASSFERCDAWLLPSGSIASDRQLMVHPTRMATDPFRLNAAGVLIPIEILSSVKSLNWLSCV